MKNRSRTSDQLDAKWAEARKKVDWMTLQTMHPYVNRLATGMENLHWAEFMKITVLDTMAESQKTNLRMAAISPGTGDIEFSLLSEFKWPIASLDLYEFDDSLKESLSKKFSNFPIPVSIQHYDLNQTKLPADQYDVVFVSHSLHHATDLKFALTEIKNALKPTGKFVGIDYFGPTRFQVEYEVWEFLKKLDSLLPDQFKVNLDPRLSKLEPRPLKRLTWDEIIEYDISEAPHSNDLRTLLFSQFKVEIKNPMGGTLLRWLLNNRAGNFDETDVNHVAMLQLLTFIEEQLISSKSIASDDLLFVLSRFED